MEVIPRSTRIPFKLDLRRFTRNSSAGTLFHTLTALSNKYPSQPLPRSLFTSSLMPSSIITRRQLNSEMLPAYLSDSLMKDATPLLGFEDNTTHVVSSDSDQMIFGPLDFEDTPLLHSSSPYHWDSFADMDSELKPQFNFTSLSTYDFGSSHVSPTGSYYDSAGIYSSDDTNSPQSMDDIYLSNWINDPDISIVPSPTSPIPIPTSPMAQPSPSFVPYHGQSHFPTDRAFSPTSFAALHPLPRSISPSSSFDDGRPVRQRVNSISPLETTLQAPSWASQLWDTSSSLRMSSTRPNVRRSPIRHSPFSDNTVRQKVPIRRGSLSSGTLFQSSSAPSPTELRVPGSTRPYSRRAESSSVSDDRDATVRRKKRLTVSEDNSTLDNKEKEKSNEGPLKSVLRPPKLAPSAWQLYFTDWIQKQQASGTRKLNVAQAAKEAGQEYAMLSDAEKEPYKQQSQLAKEARERELNAYMRTLTPEDIKRENAFRAAQRKAGKSRKSNIKDPNAPKKPLSAYFMFLQRIRANPYLVQEIFGEETETTKQSVLAAAKWRSMTDAERQPFLAQAEQEKMEYEAARRMYEEGTTGFGSSFNFSILPGSPASAFPSLKIESESDNEESIIGGGSGRPVRS